MVPHNSLLGTARVSHYHVLENDAHVPLDALQRFSFDLCHLFARATKIVSRPMHLAYAHFAAALGPCYVADYRGSADTWQDSSSTSSRASARSAQELHPSIAKTVYYA